MLRLQGWNASRKITSFKNCISANKMQYCKHVGWGNFSKDELMIIILFNNCVYCYKWCINPIVLSLMRGTGTLFSCDPSFKEGHAWFTILPGCVILFLIKDERNILDFYLKIYYFQSWVRYQREVSRKWNKYIFLNISQSNNNNNNNNKCISN